LVEKLEWNAALHVLIEVSQTSHKAGITQIFCMMMSLRKGRNSWTTNEVFQAVQQQRFCWQKELIGAQSGEKHK